MSNYDIKYIGKKAEELGFVRDTLEKVTRLADILEYFNTNPLLKDNLALKGGSSINLTIFNLPRLSVDIDLDYLKPDTKEKMFMNRKLVNSTVDKYMVSQGYIKSPKTKNPHSLDSWVYSYTNAGGNKDNIKIEINYSLRSHVLLTEERPIITEHFSSKYKVKTLAPIEIFGSKINALLSRSAARDLYDVGNMVRYGLFDESEEDLLRKCVVFYSAISVRDINKTFDTKAIGSMTKHKVKIELWPVLRNKDDFDLDATKMLVKEYISSLMILNNEEKDFLNRFENKEYIPELLFDDPEILTRIKNHPMAIWKTRKV